MIETGIERFPSRTNFLQERINFDATNSAHRKAAMKFFREGIWDIKFNARWPCTTVPQTVLMALAEYACSEELKEADPSYKAGDPFSLHTHSPVEKSNVTPIRRLHGVSKL